MVRVPETTLEAKHHALHVQPHGLREQRETTANVERVHGAPYTGSG